MAFKTELDVINDMLATLGESPLSAIDEDHSMVASGLRILHVANNREQAKGWWFNREVLTLAVDPVSENIMVPTDAISVDPLTPSNNFVQRGRRLYNPATQSYKFTKAVKCRIIRAIPFEDLPFLAADYVSWAAVREFQLTYDSDEDKAKKIERIFMKAYADFNAEHIRNVNANFLERTSTQMAANALGYNVTLGSLYR